jgi:hypothetical protein
MSHGRYSGVSEQAKASQHRLDDARALIDAKRWRGAMYLGGYAVECLLKTKLMQMFDCQNLVELDAVLHQREEIASHTTVFTHSLEILLRLAQGRDRLQQDPAMWQLFNEVNEWVPAWRYNPKPPAPADARDFLNAVEHIRHWIEHNV